MRAGVVLRLRFSRAVNWSRRVSAASLPGARIRIRSGSTAFISTRGGLPLRRGRSTCPCPALRGPARDQSLAVLPRPRAGLRKARNGAVDLARRQEAETGAGERLGCCVGLPVLRCPGKRRVWEQLGGLLDSCGHTDIPSSAADNLCSDASSRSAMASNGVEVSVGRRPPGRRQVHPPAALAGAADSRWKSPRSGVPSWT